MSGSFANVASDFASEILYVSDPHGEFDEFSHIVRSGCEAVRRIVDSTFSETMSERDRAELATLIEYPREKLASIASKGKTRADDDREGKTEGKTEGECRDLATLAARLEESLLQLAEVLGESDVARQTALAVGESGVALQTLQAAGERDVASAQAEGDPFAKTQSDWIIALCDAIRRRVVAHVHMLGDVYDRGPAPELIMDELDKFEHVDIQWGNHDIVWMGAALGQAGCIGHVVRNCARYANLSVLEDAYGIDLAPLKSFALSTYKDDPCAGFALKGTYPELTDDELDMNVKVQKAMAIIQFKVEGQLIDENPSFGLADRKLLDKMDLAAGTVVVDGETYELTDTVLPTVDFAHPYELTAQEAEVMANLQSAFRDSERLQRHIACLLEKGGMYKIAGDKLLLHACVPLNEDGSLMEVELFGKRYKGKALYDAVDRLVREAFAATGTNAQATVTATDAREQGIGASTGACEEEVGATANPRNREAAIATGMREQKAGRGLLWYLWLGAGSPVFAKSKMATFEIYFIADKAARKEVKNSFYALYENDEAMANIFADFGMDPAKSRIICGHTPVKVKDGENPVKCGGKVLVIDGGMSAAYQKTTGIAGFALVEKVPCGNAACGNVPSEKMPSETARPEESSSELELYSFDPFAGHDEAIENNAELTFSVRNIPAL